MWMVQPDNHNQVNYYDDDLKRISRLRRHVNLTGI